MTDNNPVHPLFRNQQGNPVGFFFHESIKSAFQRENLTKSITNNGGEVLDTARGADTVLVDEKHLRVSIPILQATYSTNRKKAFHSITVEPMRFVQSCIHNNRFGHPPQQRQGMGGYIGRARTAFSKKDDDDLCWYLSRRIPNPEDGGRLSTGVYKELCAAAANDVDLAWGNRHTPASWLERYKKNKWRLDPFIEKYAEKYPIHPHALYGFSRQFNKNPRKAYKPVEQNEDIIELTDADDSVHELEESDEDVKPRRLTQDSAKRRRMDSDVSSPVRITPAHKAARLPPSSPIRSHTESKRTNVDQSTPEQHRNHNLFDLSPSPEHFEPRLPEVPRSPAASAPQENQRFTPTPSPTLVQRQSSAIRSLQPPSPSLPSIRRVNLAIPRSPRPSTSFRNVAHSSPVFAASESPRRSEIKSNNTSATEPSSRSVVVPQELNHLMMNAANAPAESSITRESSHKRSSPIAQPVKKANRRFPSRHSSIQILSDESEDDEQLQETQWAPFRNTRSRSKSIEPVPVLGMKRKRKRKVKGYNLPKTDHLLEPVHEGDIEYEQEPRVADKEIATTHLISTVTSETMQEEQSVADLLILNADVSVSRTPTGVSNKTADEAGDDEIEYEVPGVSQTAPTAVIDPDKVRELKLDVSSDDEATQQQFLSNVSVAARKVATRSQRKISFGSEQEDDEFSQIFSSPVYANTPVMTAKEVLAAFDDSPESGVSAQPQHQQGGFTSYQFESPVSRNVESRYPPEQSLSSRRLTQSSRVGVSLSPTRGLTGDASVKQPQKPTGRHRVPSGGSELSPSSVGSLPRTPLAATIRPVAGARLQSQQARGKSRRDSTESTSSELQRTFPTPGTRAHAEKVRMEKELKNSPYSPPAGTKAARAIAVRQRLRERN